MAVEEMRGAVRAGRRVRVHDHSRWRDGPRDAAFARRGRARGGPLGGGGVAEAAAAARGDRRVRADVVQDALEDVAGDADAGLVRHLGVELVDRAQPDAAEQRLRAHLPRESLRHHRHLLLLLPWSIKHKHAHGGLDRLASS